MIVVKEYKFNNLFQKMNQLEQITKQMQDVNAAYMEKFRDPNYKDNVLSVKSFSILFSKIFQLVQKNQVDNSNKNKQTLLHQFKKYLQNMITHSITNRLSKCHTDQQFMHALVEQWDHFKRFTFYYHAVLQIGHDYYEQAYKIRQNQGIILKIDDPQSVFPISVIALDKFKQNVLIPFHQKIKKIILHFLNLERNNKKIDKQSLKIIFEIIWSCQLAVVGRIRSTKDNILFFKQEKSQFTKLKAKFKQYNVFFKQYVMDDVISQAKDYYNQLYQTKIRALNPLEDITRVLQILEQQRQLANDYFLNNDEKNIYLKSLYNILIERDIEERMSRNNGLKNLLQKFKHDSDQYLPQVRMFFKVLTSNKDATLHIVEKILREHILTTGARINKKINKHRQYIQQILQLKKVINRIIQQLMEKDIKICLVRDQSFKKILDSLEASKCLAEYIDYTLKQCIKLKANQEDCLSKFKNIFIILQNLTAQDSLLIYHQQHLGRRLIDSLHQPKTEIQTLFLQKLAQKIGTISLAMHMSMIKDIEQSFDITQKYNKVMPFVSFNWSLRVINPVFWSESFTKLKIQIEPPHYIFKECSVIQNLYRQQFDYRYLNLKLERGFSLFQASFKKGKFRFQAENIYVMILFHIAEQPKYEILYGNLKSKFKVIKDDKINSQNTINFLHKFIHVLIDNKIINRENQVQDPLSEGQLISINLQYNPPPNTKQNQVIPIKPSPEMHKQFQQTNLEKAKIMKEREKLIEAALVKVMKHTHSSGSNSITFQQLYQAIKNHSYLKMFDFTENTVKERLEQLLAMGYCERDEQDRKIIHYIA